MLNHEERLDIVMEVLQRISPDFYEKFAAPSQQAFHEPVENPDHAALPSPRSQTNLIGLLQRIGPLPPYSALMGQCADGMPFLFDLSDPGPGSILIIGDEYSGKTQLLRTILTSAATLNRPDQVTIQIITPNSGEFDALLSLPNTEQVISTYDRASSELVIEMASVAEQRKSGRERGSINLLAIDDLAGLLSYKEYDLSAYLRWLLKYGPRMGIWPIATLDPRQLQKVDKKLLAEFGTRLVGQSLGYHLPASKNQPEPEQLGSGNFAAVFGTEKVSFWVPNY
jgi:hypothetical protein